MRKIGQKASVGLFAILDMCRVETEDKAGGKDQKRLAPEKGQMFINFSCKPGTTSQVKDGKISKYTDFYLKHFKNPRNRLRQFPGQAFLGF